MKSKNRNPLYWAFSLPRTESPGDCLEEDGPASTRTQDQGTPWYTFYHFRACGANAKAAHWKLLRLKNPYVIVVQYTPKPPKPCSKYLGHCITRCSPELQSNRELLLLALLLSEVSRSKRFWILGYSLGFRAGGLRCRFCLGLEVGLLLRRLRVQLMQRPQL